MPSEPRRLDEGTLQIRGGAPMFDRDEHFRIEALEDGFRIHSEIAALDGSYRFECRFDYDADWLPRAARARGRRPAGALEVSIAAGDGVAVLETREGEAEPASQVLDMPPGCLIDLEPSALPMWAMTRRYDRAHDVLQHFQWLGRSLTRDLVLEGGRTALGRVGTDEEAEYFEFTEELPGPDGAVFRVEFKLATSTAGWLQTFEVRAGATHVRAARRPVAAGA
jgi:hypothetical protein